MSTTLSYPAADVRRVSLSGVPAKVSRSAGDQIRLIVPSDAPQASGWRVAADDGVLIITGPPNVREAVVHFDLSSDGAMFGADHPLLLVEAPAGVEVEWLFPLGA